MLSVIGATVHRHTTTSVPRPHILYAIKVTQNDHAEHEVVRRYSEFVTLHQILNDAYTLPPKHLLVNTFVPSAWVDDQLLAERKAGLTTYLAKLLQNPEYQTNPVLLKFLAPTSSILLGEFDYEDVLPSMVSKSMVMNVQATASTTPASSVAAAYYTSWSAGSNPPNQLDFSKFDILFYAFVVANSSSTISWDSGSQDTLRALVASARNSGKGTKIVLSIGGWAGSYWFSQAASNSGNRQTLTNALVDAVNTYGLDGIDIDWEYPNSRGSGNPFSSSDAANLLSLIKSLRAALGWSKIISAAVTHLPWIGANGRLLANVSDFAAQMTYVNIMNYDVFGASSTPGPNAPLGNRCGTSTQPQATAEAALAQWTAAGFPASKLLLGLALYGYVSQSTATKISGSLMLTPEESQPLDGAHPKDKDPESPVTLAPAGDLSGSWGQQIAFSKILSSGALKKRPDGTYVGANGYKRGWDNCSDTPFLYNVGRSTFISYDDTVSLAEKAQFAKQKGMGGCFTWSLDQDDGVALQNVIRANLGK